MVTCGGTSLLRKDLAIQGGQPQETATHITQPNAQRQHVCNGQLMQILDYRTVPMHQDTTVGHGHNNAKSHRYINSPPNIIDIIIHTLHDTILKQTRICQRRRNQFYVGVNGLPISNTVLNLTFRENEELAYIF